MSSALVALTSKLAQRLDMGDGSELIDTLKATAFKGQVSDAQMTALMVVANQYALNPWTKEIYAFPDKNNGIVPVVGVDGWSRIINGHAQFDGMEFQQDDESCTCIMYRKDRGHPIKVTEYMVECKRANVGPWQSHPRRMLRHKAMIQCARLAFGFGGIYDQDEAERIVEGIGSSTVIDGNTGEIINKPKALPIYSDAQMENNLAAWGAAIAEGRTSAAKVIAKVSSGYQLTPAQVQRIRDLEAAVKTAPTAAVPDPEFIAAMGDNEPF